MRLHFITSRAGLYCFDWHFQFGLKLIIIGKASPPFSPSLRCQLQWTLILSKSRAGSVLSHSHTILWSCRCTCGFNCADHFEKMSEEIPSCWCTRQSIVHRGAALALWQSGDDDVAEWGGGCCRGWKFSQKSSYLVKHTLFESHAGRMTLREQGQGGKRTRKEEEATFYPETGNNQIYCCIRSDSCKELFWENHTSLWKESYL